MNLNGLKMAVLGDSITAGVGVENTENIYYNRIKKEFGLSEVCVNGIPGSRIANQRTPTVWELTADRNFISRINELDENSDIVVVFGGTNDFGHGDAPIGKPDDNTEYTFWGACNILFEKLVTRFPESQIIFMGPLHRTDENNPKGTDGKKAEPSGTLYEYNEIIKSAAKKYGIPFFDMLALSGITPEIQKQRELYMPDGLHPNDAGHAKIAAKLGNFIKTLM